MIKKLSQYPIAYLMIIIVLYSVYDYFEHIGRNSSIFEKHPWYWLLFTASAVLSLILITLFLKNSMQRVFKQKNLIFEVVAIGIWLALYLSILGPLFNKIFWPFNNLHFKFTFGPIFIIPISYSIIRIIVNLIIGKKAFYSK